MNTRLPLIAGSGDLLADRRHSYAQMLASAGDFEAALSLMEQALEIAPSWSAGWYLHGDYASKCGRRDQAVASFSRSLALDPADTLGASLRLATLGAAARPLAMPEAYVRGLFDQYAPRFDNALVEGLGYHAPWHLAEMVRQALSERDADSVARTLDLGCGTGLLGEALRGTTSWLAGIDLSPGMLAGAAAKSVYDRLVEADAVAALLAERELYDLVGAADVLGYLGALEDLFAAVHASLVPGGLFAATAEAQEDDGFALGEGLRFRHSESYLRSTAERSGLRLTRVTRTVLRSERGEDVAGFLLLAEKPRVEARALEMSIEAALGPAGEPASPTLQ